jgi:nucleotide-binding universal stress UspA family protein
MYSIVVMVAVVTSFMAPLLLRLTMRMVKVTQDEADRMAADASKGLFDAEKLRVLVPTAGGPNALVGARIAMCLAHRSAHPVTMLYVQRLTGLIDRLRARFQPNLEGQNLTYQLDTIKQAAAAAKVQPPEIRRQASRVVATAINAEAAKGYDLILSGASGTKRGIRGQKLEDLVAGAPCHVAIIKPRGDANEPFKRLLVPVDGSFLSRVAMEFAIRYAEGAGPDAAVTFAILTEQDLAERFGVGSVPDTVDTAQGPRQSMLLGIGKLAMDGGLDKLSPVFKATKVKTRLLTTDGGVGGSVRGLAASGEYDLLVLGAEHRAIHHRLFFGYENERLVEESPISVVLIVPKVAGAFTS